MGGAGRQSKTFSVLNGEASGHGMGARGSVHAVVLNPVNVAHLDRHNGQVWSWRLSNWKHKQNTSRRVRRPDLQPSSALPLPFARLLYIFSHSSMITVCFSPSETHSQSIAQA